MRCNKSSFELCEKRNMDIQWAQHELKFWNSLTLGASSFAHCLELSAKFQAVSIGLEFLHRPGIIRTLGMKQMNLALLNIASIEKCRSTNLWLKNPFRYVFDCLFLGINYYFLFLQQWKRRENLLFFEGKYFSTTKTSFRCTVQINDCRKIVWR